MPMSLNASGPNTPSVMASMIIPNAFTAPKKS